MVGEKLEEAGFVRPTSDVVIEKVMPQRWSQIHDWDEVVHDSARPSVFLTRDWVQAWWQNFSEDSEPWVIRVGERGGRTLGIAPLYVSRPRHVIQLPMRRLGIIGDRVVGSEYLGLIARAGLEAEIAQVAVEYLQDAGARWDVVKLLGLVENDPAGAALEQALMDRASHIRSNRLPCSMIALPGDFDTYLARLSPKFRRTYHQRANKLRRMCKFRIFRTNSEAEIKPHLEALFHMHQRRWNAAGLPGVFADPRMRSFYLNISKRLLKTRRLQFWHLEVDGSIRASQYGFAYNQVLHSLQEAFDTSFRSDVGGLGVILRAHVIEAAIQEGLRGYDFLGGTEEFKTRWGTSPHYIRNVRAASTGVRGLLAWLTTVEAADGWLRLKKSLWQRSLRGPKGP